MSIELWSADGRREEESENEKEREKDRVGERKEKREKFILSFGLFFKFPP